MKLTFEGRTIHDIVHQMEAMLAQISLRKASADIAANLPPAVDVAKPQGLTSAEAIARIVNKPVDKPVYKPVEKKARTEKQLANDEKMRVAALARVAARRDAKAGNVADVDPVKESAPTPFDLPPEPEEVDPAEMVKIRLKTIEELQAAYANGHQKEVFELLSRFGNGAKSFRELPPESFVPIRRAIDLGALE